MWYIPVRRFDSRESLVVTLIITLVLVLSLQYSILIYCNWLYCAMIYSNMLYNTVIYYTIEQYTIHCNIFVWDTVLYSISQYLSITAWSKVLLWTIHNCTVQWFHLYVKIHGEIINVIWSSTYRASSEKNDGRREIMNGQSQVS